MMRLVLACAALSVARAAVKVTSFRVIDGSDGTLLDDPVEDGAVFVRSPGPFPRRASFEAVVSTTNGDSVAKVSMSIQKTDDDYVERRTDSVSPYSFFGDSNGTFNTRTLQEGPYVITATPEDQNGDYGEALSVAFRLEDQEVAVTRFVLMDAENQLEIEDDVQDGQVFALDDLETQKLSVKVETTGSVRYVSMNLNDGYKMRSEFSKPYSPFGRSGTKVRSGLQPGEFTLEATPYDQEDHPGASRTVSFTVVPSAEQTLEVGHCSGRDVIKKIRDTQGDVFANAMDEAVIDQKCLDLHKANTVYLVSDNTTETPQILPSDEGVDVAFLDQFFDGRTHLNTETDSDDAKLMDTAVWIKEAYEQFAQTHVIAQPNLKQFNKGFDLDDVSENEQTAEQNFNCEIPAIMCCWTRDRQAGDNNGNCRTPYDERCVDADPMDNTDICYADAQRSPTSFHTENGFSFYGHADEAVDEGDAHCHGFITRPDEPLSVENVFAGNSLFYVSLYDHLYSRGYVESVAGGPMCGCVEQMPTVSRADCTELDVDAVYSFTLDAQGVATLEQTSLDVSFRSCGGNPRNNDLFSKYAVFYDDDADGKYDIERRLVGTVDNDDSNCPKTLAAAFAEDTELNFVQ